MSKRLRLADAALKLEPCRQGDLDGLCGVYAVINAVRLALYPDRELSAGELELMFDAGLRRLQRARQLRAALTGGMFETVWASVGDDIVAAASEIAGRSLTLTLGPAFAYSSDAALLAHIRGGIRDGNPVLLGVQGRYDHWTVAARFSRYNLMLFDSSAHHRIAVSSLGVEGSFDKPLSVGSSGLAYLVRSAASAAHAGRSPP